MSHNPYFSRWFSAIINKNKENKKSYDVTILILVDGFLQSVQNTTQHNENTVTILILVDGFLQYL